MSTTIFMASAFTVFAGTAKSGNSKNEVKHPAWSYNQTIYEVNLRQYTQGGTFNEFAERLPELKKLGVGIIWLMPINPIGVKNRKGTLGSPYSVKDYTAVNPRLGTLKDFKTLVQKIHSLGMHVIIDWVADHTSWDNKLTVEHPDWYKKDSSGNFVPPVKDWSDVIALDYNNKDLRRYMIDAMKFWVKECGIDGFRCDVADMVPLSFWKEARPALDSLKPVFMLAEAEKPYMHQAFDMTYSWGLYKLMNKVATGEKNSSDIVKYLKKDIEEYPPDAFRMLFTTNHDENSWNGTVFERLGDAAPAFGALTVALPGMPLLYGGQEAGLNKRLKFFEKDPIDWKKSKFRGLYTKLFNLKLNSKALLSGEEGGKMIYLSKPGDKNLLAFVRQKDDDKIIFVFNLSNKTLKAEVKSKLLQGNYSDLFGGREVSLGDSHVFDLKPWTFKFLVLKTK